jgi:hypothetical protein
MNKLPLLGLAVAACTRLPVPLTAADVPAGGAPALVGYLSQPDANPAVCDGVGPQHPLFGGDPAEALGEGLRDGRIPPRRWAACASRILDHGDWLLGPITTDYARLATDPVLERSSLMQARLAAMHQVIVERPVGGSAEALDELVATVRRAHGRLGPVAAHFAGELVEAVELSGGRLGGRVVDRAVLDELQRAGFESRLRHCAYRLPDAGLRTEARRRIIRMHILGAPDPTLRGQAAAIEEMVLRRGYNPVSLSEHPPVDSRLDARALPVRQIVVRQDAESGTATLLGRVEGRGDLSILPALALRGAIQVTLRGLARPVTICSPPAILDPTPCLDPRALEFRDRLLTFDGDSFRFAERLPARAAVDLARAGATIDLAVSAAGHRLASLNWPIVFQRPSALVVASQRAGERGPDLQVRVSHAPASRLVFAVAGPAGERFAVVDRRDLPFFSVISRGGPGRPGTEGWPGRDGLGGSTGVDASCPGSPGSNGGAGEDGTNGGDGRDGTDGGPGGAIQVEVSCRQDDRCGETLSLVRGSVRSQGGPGGSGGPGGRGGAGGPGGYGGLGASCTDPSGAILSVGGGSPGLSGTSGVPGYPGRSGNDGAPGPVSVRVVN